MLQIANLSESEFRKSALNFITSLASIRPWSPTEQFAQPLLATTPLIFFLVKFIFEAVTECETIELLVNTPAQVVSDDSDHKIPKSNLLNHIYH